MSEVNTQFYKKKKAQSFYFALAFLIFVICITGGLYVYTGDIEKKNLSLQNEITQKDQHIQNIEKKENIRIYGIYKEHEVFFKQLALRSELPSLILHLKKNFAKYGIESRGFHYSNGMAGVELSSKKNDLKQAYQKIITFLDEYSQDEKARFNIEPISSFSGHEKINYSANFSIK